MSILRFFGDENLDHALVLALRQREPSMDIMCVGEAEAPARGTKDGALLAFAEENRRVFLTNDRRTVPQHLANHFAAGHHTWGVVLLRQGFPLAHYLADILLIWGASDSDEWFDRTDVIPY